MASHRRLPCEPDHEGTHAKEVAAVAGADSDLASKAKDADTWATAERAKTALIGAESPVVLELLGVDTPLPQKVGHTVITGISVGWLLSDAGRCTGVYLTGATKDARSLDASARKASALELLSQAVGRPVALPGAPTQYGATPPTSTWFEGGYAVTGRWLDGALVELRIGDATP